jgi:hypothetical protein
MMNVEKGYYVLEGLLFFHLKFYVFILITGSSLLGVGMVAVNLDLPLDVHLDRRT